MLNTAQKTANIVADRERRQVGTSTSHRIKHSGEAIDIDGSGRQRISQSPLDRLYAKRSLTKRQFEAGEKFREDCETAGLDAPIPSLTLESSGGSAKHPVARLAGYLSERQHDAREKCRDAERVIGIRSSAIIHASMFPSEISIKGLGAKAFDRKPGTGAEAAFIEVLKVSLDRLADHYFGHEKRTSKIRAWSAS